MSYIEDLKARVKAAQEAAKAAELSEEEREAALLVEQEREAQEQAAELRGKRRGIMLASRLAAAKTRAAGAYLLEAIDLVKCFPLGSVDPELEARMPGKGVILVREPEPDVYARFVREYEANKAQVPELMTEILCSCLIDERESPKDDEHRAVEVQLLRSFCQRYGGAATKAGGAAAELGGLRNTKTKRGRE